MVMTGVRVGEACGMSWDAIDLDRGLASVVRIVSWDHWTRDPELVEQAKTEESIRVIHLASELIVMLKRMKVLSKDKVVFSKAVRAQPRIADGPTDEQPQGIVGVVGSVNREWQRHRRSGPAGLTLVLNHQRTGYELHGIADIVAGVDEGAIALIKSKSFPRLKILDLVLNQLGEETRITIFKYNKEGKTQIITR